MVAFSLQRFSYVLAADDRIAAVDAHWLAFAQENGAPLLTQQTVLGRSLWDFIVGYETRRLYEAIFARVRSEDGCLVLPFRCDSPTLRRHMTMRVTRQDGGIAIECILDRVEPTQHLRLLHRDAQRNDSQLTVCSVCLRALVEPAGWLEIEDAAVRLHLLEASTVPQLRYTVCTQCTESQTQS